MAQIKKIRVALIGVSHWHTGFYLDPLLEMAHVEVCGISDPDQSVVDSFKKRIGCVGQTDYRAMCDSLKPDFVVVLGRHCEMASTAQYLIEEGIAFAIEKPCGMNAIEVASIAANAKKKSVFAAVPLVMRHGPFVKQLSQILSQEEATYATFRFIAGSASRYLQNGCSWMLDPLQSGGGCTINLGVHFFDLACMILGPNAKVSSTLMSNDAWKYPVEDYSAVTIMSNNKSVLIETGYLYPAPTNHFDMHYSIRTSKHYLTAWGPMNLEIRDYEGHSVNHAISTTNVPHYVDFMHETLDRFSKGQEPLAGLDAMLDSMHLIDQAYQLSRPLTVK